MIPDHFNDMPGEEDFAAAKCIPDVLYPSYEAPQATEKNIAGDTATNVYRESTSSDLDALAGVYENYGLQFLAYPEDLQKEGIAWNIHTASKALLSTVKVRTFNAPLVYVRKQDACIALLAPKKRVEDGDLNRPHDPPRSEKDIASTKIIAPLKTLLSCNQPRRESWETLRASSEKAKSLNNL